MVKERNKEIFNIQYELFTKQIYIFLFIIFNLKVCVRYVEK